MKVFGFTLLRNGVKYDYSFAESLQSLSPLCQKIYLALGDGEDSTADALARYDFLKIIPTVWDDSLREGGLILSQQTNVALEALRKDQREEKGCWGIYLQADEVIHERDYDLIRQDLKKAEETGCDAVRFRYLHFWQSHHHIAINKKWYPQEIRAVRLDSQVESWGDAQSFRHTKKVYESDAFIYHYGHVREEESYQEKKKGFLRMYASDQNLEKYTEKSEKKDANTEVLAFWSSHPKVMHERIRRLGEEPVARELEKVFILGKKEEVPAFHEDNVRAKEVTWVSSVPRLRGDDEKVVYLGENWLNKLRFGEKTPQQMRSKLARPWSKEFQFVLRLSAQGIGYDG